MSRTGHLRDEELLDVRDAEREQHLRACSACARRRAVHEQARAAIRGLDRDARPPSAALLLLEEAAAGHPSKRWLPALAAGVVVGVIVAAWVIRSRTPLPPPVIDELALDHLHYEHKTEAAAVQGDGASISSWFSGHLGFAPHLGAIEATTIEGAKPCRIAGKWTALVWLDRAGHWLSLFTMPEQVAGDRGCATAQGVRVCASPDPRGGSRVLVGDLPDSEMLRLVDESLR